MTLEVKRSVISALPDDRDREGTSPSDLGDPVSVVLPEDRNCKGISPEDLTAPELATIPEDRNNEDMSLMALGVRAETFSEGRDHKCMRTEGPGSEVEEGDQA